MYFDYVTKNARWAFLLMMLLVFLVLSQIVLAVSLSHPNKQQYVLATPQGGAVAISPQARTS